MAVSLNACRGCKSFSIGAMLPGIFWVTCFDSFLLLSQLSLRLFLFWSKIRFTVVDFGWWTLVVLQQRGISFFAMTASLCKQCGVGVAICPKKSGRRKPNIPWLWKLSIETAFAARLVWRRFRNRASASLLLRVIVFPGSLVCLHPNIFVFPARYKPFKSTAYDDLL